MIFLLKNGSISIKFLPRISQADTSFGTGYAEKTKHISSYFKQEYKKLCFELEQPGYFRERLVYNYLYKGPVLEWYLKIKVRFEKNYQLFHELLPIKGKMLDIGCGNGFMAYLIHFAAREREFTGIDYDEDKIETAANCFSKNSKMNFIFAGALEFYFDMYDAIIMADVLHYMQPEEQKLLIEKCIRHLNPGGIIILRDGNKDLHERHKGTMLTEYFSTKFFMFNRTTSKGLSYISSSQVRDIAEANGMECIEIDQTKYTSNIVFVIKVKG